MNTIGDKLYLLRKSRGLTQPQLGELLNTNSPVSLKNISAWEKNRNEPNIETLVMYSKFFNVTVDSLLGIEKEELKPTLEYSDTHQQACKNVFETLIRLSQDDKSNVVGGSLYFLLEWIKCLSYSVLEEKEALNNPDYPLRDDDRPPSFYFQKTTHAIKAFMETLRDSDIDFSIKTKD